MTLPIFQIDAFANKVFSGNPAAVILLDQPLPEEMLQAIAAENNVSETAFILLKENSFGLRWFTPVIEIDLCGHATLASAFVLFREGYADGDVVRFETLSGTLAVRKTDELLSMDFPSRPPAPAPGTQELAEALGARPLEVYAARDLMAVFETESDIAALRPDIERIAALAAFAVIVTAPGREVDFVSRFFAPKAGISEDPVTGSAHCTLVPYWAKRLGKQKLNALQISKRGGELFCEDNGERVTISGRAVEFLRGKISLDSA